MADELSPASEAIIRDLLAAGAFPDRATVLEHAVGLLGRRQELKRLLEEGMNSGPSLTEGEVFSEIEALIEQTGRESTGSYR